MKHIIFLSASIPTSEKGIEYFRTADPIAIRDAVRALAVTVIPYSHLIWGGHPAITPLIRNILIHSGKDVNKHVTLYQSKFFDGKYPKDNDFVEDIHLIDIVSGDDEYSTQNNSIKEMRIRMLKGHSYSVGIFIGGADGVIEEFNLFRKYNPDALVLPIASTGGAAEVIYNRGEYPNSLADEYDYQTLFKDLLNI